MLAHQHYIKYIDTPCSPVYLTSTVSHSTSYLIANVILLLPREQRCHRSCSNEQQEVCLAYLQTKAARVGITRWCSGESLLLDSNGKLHKLTSLSAEEIAVCSGFCCRRIAAGLVCAKRRSRGLLNYSHTVTQTHRGCSGSLLFLFITTKLEPDGGCQQRAISATFNLPLFEHPGACLFRRTLRRCT